MTSDLDACGQPALGKRQAARFMQSIRVKKLTFSD